MGRWAYGLRLSAQRRARTPACCATIPLGWGGIRAMFVIVWGRKVKRLPVGHVADFCPICRAQKPFALVHVGMVNHVYYVSTGTGDFVGYERVCADCATPIPTDIARYSGVAPRAAPLGELKAQTFPNLDAV